MARLSPLRWHMLTAFTLAGTGTAALWSIFSRNWGVVPWVFSWLGSINALTFAYYGIDKRQAQRGGRRIPELVLHALAVAGGCFGAFLAMQYFRHKTIKGHFRIVFWTIVVVQLLLVLWLVRKLFWF